ncbi:MAG: NUDIX hydrolase [Acidiferrobacteraceae bacterium]
MSTPEALRWYYRGRVIDVVAEQAHFPDGRSSELEIVRHPGGAAVVALNDRGKVCLLRQYRHVANEWLWELPAGRRDGAEEPLITAQRELAEETGITAQTWQPLGHLVSSPGVFTEVVHLFCARDLTENMPMREDEEYIEVHWVSLDEALAWASSGQIYDAKTIIGLFRASTLS